MMYFLSHNDIQDNALELIISSELSKANNFIYLTATQNLKNMRAESSCLSLKLIPYKSGNKFANLYSITEFLLNVSQQTYESKEYLSNADQRFVLAKVINYYYADNPTMQKTMYRMRYDLNELYSLLLFHNKEISAEQIDIISEDFSMVENDIFSIYALYKAVVDKLIAFISCGKNDDLLKSILGENILKNTKTMPIKTFSEKQKDIITGIILKADILICDGFLFFNEIQRFILSAAIKEKKSVYFISKQFTNNTGAFFFERSIKGIAEKLSVQVDVINLPSETEKNKTALDYIKSVFPLSNPIIPNGANELISDGSIQFIQPFISREEELRYVVKSISKRLQNAYTGDINEIIRMACNDVAIVLAIDKENYEERISNLFREVGLFIFKQELLKDGSFSNIDIETFESVYFNRHDFLDADIRRLSGESLSYQEKYIMFERCFMRIDINRNSRPIASYPVGQFVLEVYRTVSEGMSIEGFKNILYSNWRYTVDKTQIKWSDFISDFKYIEIYFENKKDIVKWRETAHELVFDKKELESNPFYIYHPLAQIKAESLDFFCSLLDELNELTDRISNIVGSIDSHLNTLKNVVMQAGSILGSEDDKLEFEQVILKRLVSAINDIGTSSLMANLDSNYFAQNVRTMLTDWENQNKSETENTIRLNVVNLENMKKYKCCYFIMCEADKYPRRYFDRFPFTTDNIKILQDPKYGIEITPFEVKGLDYHLELERYLFKNVLDFTEEQLIITYCEKENGNHFKPSIFAVDVAAAFGIDITYIGFDAIVNSVTPKFTQDIPNCYIKRKPEYTLTELAIFKLCPRLYYHRQTDENAGVYLSRLQLKFYMEAVLYCDLLRRFMEYNLENKKVYQKNSNEYEGIIASLFKASCTDNVKYFSFFTQYEIEDAIRNVSGKVKGFIENANKNLKSNTYTIISYQNKRYSGNGYKLIIEHDNRVVDYDLKTWRMSQNSTYLEFLVLKTSDNKSEITHYADMIKALDENNPNEDRINLISRIIAKINIQFDSKRFAGDGIKRTDELVNQICGYDFSKAAVMESEYCNYCRLNDVCMGR